MKRLCKLSDKRRRVKLSEDMTVDILHRLPSKPLARFKSVSKCWQKFIADSSLHYSCRSQRWRPQPTLVGFFYRSRQTRKHSQIRFFFSSKESSSLVNDIDGSCLDESVSFLGKKVYIVASSNGFLLCTEHRKKHGVYYVYNPACTRQHLALPKTQICMEDPAVGFTCKVDDPDRDAVSFTVVRYAIPRNCYELQWSVTIESFSSETNVWTANKLILDVPVMLYRSTHLKSLSSAAAIDGVFCWLDNGCHINVYDSVYKSFWDLKSPEGLVAGDDCYFGLSGGAFYLALNCDGEDITVWKLESKIRSRDAVWVRKYAADVASTVMQCPEAFGLAGDTLRVEAFGLTRSLSIKVQHMAIHPALPHIFYFDVRGKVISYDMETNNAQLVYDFGEPWWRTQYYKLVPYEWHQWPRLL